MLCDETEHCARISGVMRRLTRVTVTLVTVLGLLHFVLAQDRRRPAAVKQPIPFSHRQHAQAGVKCSSCHFKTETDEQAGLPSASDCAQCHQEARSSAALMEKDITWVRVYHLPDFVFFSHQAHLRAKTDCRTCHGPVERRTVLWKEKDISMKACVACHKEKRASTACNYCHELNR